jgi:site-specific DNA-methyltransferase (adenine-specific)
MGELIAKARQLRAVIQDREKRIKDDYRHLTADEWNYGEVLVTIKHQCHRKGDWGKALTAIDETYQRAEEATKIRGLFETAAEAGKVSVRRALKMIRRNPTEDEFCTADWLFGRLDNTYHFTLDAAAKPENTKCKRYITPEMDATKQDWCKLSKGGAAFCNPPFSDVERFVRHGWEQAQSGIVVVMIVPIWPSQDWFIEVVLRYGEVRFVGRRATYHGTGARDGFAAGHACGGPNAMETMVVVFRKGQTAFLGESVFAASWIEALDWEAIGADACGQSRDV